MSPKTSQRTQKPRQGDQLIYRRYIPNQVRNSNTSKAIFLANPLLSPMVLLVSLPHSDQHPRERCNRPRGWRRSNSYTIADFSTSSSITHHSSSSQDSQPLSVHAIARRRELNHARGRHSKCSQTTDDRVSSGLWRHQIFSDCLAKARNL